MIQENIKPFFSIIVPVYNTEKYIARCLTSCIEQTFDNIEIIVVDDCGNDNAMQIAHQYAKSDSRIQIIRNHKNLGVFIARIIGGKIAKGEYVIYLDSDDFLSPLMCQTLYETIVSMGGGAIDILGFYSEITPQPKKGNPFITSPLGNYQQPEIIEKISFHWMIWNKAYHHSIITQAIDFFDTHFKTIPKINMAEDTLKFFVICLFAKNYYGIKDVLHYYFKNEKSITRDLNNLKRHKSAILGFSQTISMLQKIKNLHPLAQKQAEILIQTLSNHKRETQYSYWITRAKQSKGYVGNLLRAIKATKSPKKKIIAYRKICLYVASLGLLKT